MDTFLPSTPSSPISLLNSTLSRVVLRTGWDVPRNLKITGQSERVQPDFTGPKQEDTVSQ